MSTGGGASMAESMRRNFFPEESFKSLHNYLTALKETPSRFVDRLTSRSQDSKELNEVKAESQHEMKKNLSWWDLIWFGLGAVVGSGIFVLTGHETRANSGPAVVLSYVLSGTSALLSVFCYTEFAVEIPVAGGSFAYTRVELGDFTAFIVAGNILVEYVIGNAAVARAWTSYFATLCNHDPNDFRVVVNGLSSDYSHLDPIAAVVTAVVAALAATSTKISSRFNYISSIFHLLVLVFIIIAGLTHADLSNLTPLAPFGAEGVVRSSAVLYYAYVGFDAIATLAEESKNPSRDIPIGLVGSMVLTTLLYCAMALTLCLMQPFYEIDNDAPFSVAFEAAGMGWAKYLVAAGALKGMTTVLLVGIVGQARYVTHIARTHMMPPWLARVNETTGTPVNSTVVMVAASAIIALFTQMHILANLLSISTLLIFVLVALALLVRRYYVSGETSDGDRRRLVGCLGVIIGSAIGSSVFWGEGERGRIGCVVCAGVWFLGTLGLCLMVPKAREPKLWGAPLVPWLPSASLAINIFLLGSVDAASYVRLGIWTGVLLVYYLLVGVHASYDAAYTQKKTMIEEGCRDEVLD